MTGSWESTRIWLLAAFTAAAVLVAATTAAAVIGLDHHNNRDGGSRDDDRGTSWMWMHAQVDDEADYLSRMVAHHREAVAAAGQLTRSDRPQMRAFGADIIRTQSAQIEQMNAWLDRWYPEEPADPDYQPMMRDLADLSGNALDRAFLRDMTVHHMAAVMMSQQLLAHGLATHDEVAELARTIRDQQHTEILRMQQWLSSWYGESRHGGPSMMR